MAKDFFDEELKKTDKKESWFDTPAPVREQPKRSKPLYITAICIAVLLCFILGWVLCTVFQNAVYNYNTDEAIANNGDDILDTVIRYLKGKYYKDISDEDWLKAIEYAGTALMQKAGDKYSMLMSPQTYYDFLYTTSTPSSDELFGITLSVKEGVGIYISSVVANGPAYGKLQSGDIILKLSDMLDSDDNAPTVDGISYTEMVIGEFASGVVTDVLEVTKSAKFHVLRMGVDNEQGFELFTVDLVRSKITPVASDYPYTFIEFYFDSEHYNISVPTQKDGNGNFVITSGEYTTYEERNLNKLPDGTGYVHINEFMDYTKVDDNGNVVMDENNKPVKVSAADEFKEVMRLFKQLNLKHLVLDLKGNPGGNVSYVSDIAGLLVTDDKLTAQEKSLVTDNGTLLITTLKFPKLSHAQTYTRVSSYQTYFGSVADECSIVVWTDGNSASASELLTGALLDYKTAVQMGTKTYGKGIAQTWEALPFYGTAKNLNGEYIQFNWAIYYTCANYYSPLGANIHGSGYTPQGSYNNLTDYADLWDAANTYWQ